MTTQKLPIEAVLPDIQTALEQHDTLVLQAAPGAGKTTLVPLALLQSRWLTGKIIMVEPRRLAARAAAERMADLLDEAVGQTVGYHVRLERRVQPSTKIEVLTEGMLLQRLVGDPELTGVSAVILDEFHERSINADLCLSLLLYLRSVFRDTKDGVAPLKLMIMSATLDLPKLTGMLDQVAGPVAMVSSEGRQFPVDMHYSKAAQLKEDICQLAMPVLSQVIPERPGNVLVFLPGLKEIERVEHALKNWLEDIGMSADVVVAPLHAQLPLAEQKRAVLADDAGRKTVVLATAIAESSVTVEGITTVIDSGRARLSQYDLRSNTSRLQTCWVSRASADQRAGRAGRLGPGACYRLWSEEQQKQLVAHATPEILRSDLSTALLTLLTLGVDDMRALDWLDPPSDAQIGTAADLLCLLGAIEPSVQGQWQLTQAGQTLSRYPAGPRIARLLACAQDHRVAAEGAALAALLDAGTRALPGQDLAHWVGLLVAADKPFAKRARQAQRLYQSYRRMIGSENIVASGSTQQSLGVIVAQAFPDRVGKCVDQSNHTYQLSNGRMAQLPPGSDLIGATWLVVCELGGFQGQAVDQIYAAVRLSKEEIYHDLSQILRREQIIDWEKQSGKRLLKERLLLGDCLIEETAIEDVTVEALTSALLTYFGRVALDKYFVDKNLVAWLRRLRFAIELLNSDGHRIDPPAETLPDFDEQSLKNSLDAWCLPFVDVQKLKNQKDLQALPWAEMLKSRLSWQQQQWLDKWFPERLHVPSGSHIKIDYGERPPVLSVKLQEMFGCVETPTIAQGRYPLVVHLLSPAKRPLQVTQDLKGFWQQGYHEVKKEMKGRYPKHPWPDDPLAEQATRFTKSKRKSD